MLLVFGSRHVTDPHSPTGQTDMSKDARILYASDSIEYILGYLPHEVINKPCWDYFHPEEMPFAQSVHGRGVQLDKAAVLRYCRVKHKLGFWVCCECVFSVVYNVLVACTSIYRQGMSSQSKCSMPSLLFSR